MKVVQKEGEEVSTEILASSIVAISEGIKKLRAGRLNEKALILLIQNNTKGCGKYGAGHASVGEVRAVLDSMETLEMAYLKKKPAK